MSNRIVKHSSRYRGPAGDSRPAAEIFAGIEAREQETDAMKKELTTALDKALKSRKLSSAEGRIEAIRSIFIKWLADNDLDFREQLYSSQSKYNPTIHDEGSAE